MCISETHLTGEQTINLKNYTFLPHNRKVTHKKAPKTFGGVGTFFKDSLLNIYDIDIVDQSYEGIQGIKLCDKSTLFTCIIYNCYLAPYTSVYGNNSTDYLAHLITELYLHSEADIVYVCGDLNGRIGNLKDDISDIDILPPRINIDNTIHGHGEAIIDFVTDCKLCVLNGRLNPENDNFTFISEQGRSVVDYIITPQDCFNKCTSFHVYTMNELSEKCNIGPLISSNCKVPDHSIVHVDFKVNSLFDPNQSHTIERNVHDDVQPDNMYKHRKYRFEHTPDLFMASECWKSAMNVLIDTSISCIEDQQEIDNLYEYFCKTLTNEMDIYLRYSDAPKYIRKKLKNCKPYWNDELYNLWLQMSNAEKTYSKFKGPRNIREILRREYVTKRKCFDKTLRKNERHYNQKVIDNIEEVCTTNPREFSALLKRLGPRKCSDIPFKVYNDAGQLVSDIDTVLNTWKTSFHGLLNRPESVDFDDDFYNECMQQKIEMEQDDHDINPDLNAPITLAEIQSFVRKLKKQKATGIDRIPNEVLKRNDIIVILHKLFVRFFNSGILPTVWLKAIITPIPKSSSKIHTFH